MTTFFGPCCGGLTSRGQLARAAGALACHDHGVEVPSAPRIHRPNGQTQEKLANAASAGSINGLDRLTSVNEQGMNDPQVDEYEGDRPKWLNRDKQEVGEGLNAHEDDAEPASPGRPEMTPKPAARTIRPTIRCH